MYKKLVVFFFFICLSCSNNISSKTKNSKDSHISDSSQTTLEISFTPVFDTILDSRDSNYYQVVLIGDTWWMTEDLRYIPYNNAKSNDSLGIIRGVKEYSKVYYKSYGNICPEGWELPKEDDWLKLLEYADVSYKNQNYYNNYTHQDIGYFAYAVKVGKQHNSKYILNKNFGGNNSTGINLGFYGHVTVGRDDLTFSGFNSIGLYGFRDKNDKISCVMLYNSKRTNKFYEYYGTNQPVLIRCIKKTKENKNENFN